MATEIKDKQKEKTFGEWIEAEEVFVQLDPRKEGVEVPEQFRAQAALTLKFSRLYNTQPEHDEKGVFQYLKFSGVHERCFVPWSAIWGLNTEGGNNQIWQEDLPAELVVTLAKEKFREIKDRFLGKKEEKLEEKAEEKSEERPRKSHLRRIK